MEHTENWANSVQQGSEETRLEICILSHSISSNAVGRAIAMNLVAQQVAESTVWAVDDGSPWPGIRQFGVTVEKLAKNQLPTWKLPRSEVRRVLWVSKGISPLDEIVQAIRHKDNTVDIVLDLDDDDAALAADFKASSFMNWLRLNPARRMHPSRIRSAQRKTANVADLFTFSSNALATQFPEEWVPAVRITHARPVVEPAPHLPSSDKIRIGTFGTIRGHKGARRLSELMEFSNAIELHTFKNSGVALSTEASERHVQHEPSEPLAEVYGAVDVAYIPMSANSGADVQLPAKLIDAMALGVPIVTSPTSAIVEIAADSVYYASLVTSVEETLSILKMAASDRRTEVRTRFLQVASASVLGSDLRLALQASPSRTKAAADG